MTSLHDDPQPVDFRKVLDECMARARRTRWGTWIYHESNFTLECRDQRGQLYEIDLDRCRTSAEVLDWIFQVHGKTWATPRIMSDLLDAFHDLLDPQACLCSFGESKKIRPRDILKTRKAHAGAGR
jgi:hypothetical protein